MNDISYGRQWIDNEDIQTVVEALKSKAITQGEYIDRFEKSLAEYTGSKYAVAVSSGTSALHIIYMALGLKKDDELITTPITFAATANAGLYCNAVPKFVDIDSLSFLIDEDLIEQQITEKTKILAPVHYGGLPCNMEKISHIAKKYNLKVVEDACHSAGSFYKNIKTGNCLLSDAAVFSFHPVKHITTGEGGAILTNNKEIYEKCLKLRSHGMQRDNFIYEQDSPTYHEMIMLGYNYRMTDIQAALGLSQLKKLDEFVKRRQFIAETYKKELSEYEEIVFQADYSDRINSYHLMSAVFKTNELRDRIFYKLKEKNIHTQIHYMPVNKHPYYAELGYNYKDTPKAYDFYRRELSLPIYPKLTDEELMYVIDNIKNIIKGA